MKAHIPAQLHKLYTAVLMRMPPCPVPGIFLTFLQSAGFQLSNTGQGNTAFIHLLAFLHHFKDTLRYGHCGQYEVQLLGKLIDRQRCLAYIHQIGSKCPQSDFSTNRKESTDTCDNGIIEIGNADNRWNRSAGIGQCLRTRPAQTFIATFKFLIIFLFMVKYLNHLDTVNHLLNKAVQLSHGGLLM